MADENDATAAAAFAALLSDAAARFAGESVDAPPPAPPTLSHDPLDASIAARSAVWLARRDEHIEGTRRALAEARRAEESEASFMPRINAVRFFRVARAPRRVHAAHPPHAHPHAPHTPRTRCPRTCTTRT